MKDKIKISLPESVLSTMKSDCKNFNFLKSDDSINFNAFVNTLVVNFYETFSASEEALRDDVSKALSGLPDKSKERVYSDVIKIIARRENVATDGKPRSFRLSRRNYPKKQSLSLKTSPCPTNLFRRFTEGCLCPTRRARNHVAN